jgi:hypothetical protein
VGVVYVCVLSYTSPGDLRVAETHYQGMWCTKSVCVAPLDTYPGFCMVKQKPTKGFVQSRGDNGVRYMLTKQTKNDV